MGNGIYLEKKLLDSHSQRVILKIVNIKSTESHVYLFRDLNGVLGLNIVKAEVEDGSLPVGGVPGVDMSRRLGEGGEEVGQEGQEGQEEGQE